MALYNITNSVSGLDLGNYEGATEPEALDAIARITGYRDQADALEVTGGDGSDLIVTLVADWDADAFISTADSRETSREIMEAIAFFSRNKGEAEALWNGDGLGTVCHPSDLWERVTRNGRRDADEFCWGAAGRGWWDELQKAT